MGTLHIDKHQQFLGLDRLSVNQSSQHNDNESVRLSARINDDEEGLTAYRHPNQTPFDFEEEEEDENDWKQIQLKAAGISSSTSKLMNK